MNSLVDSHCHLYYEPYINDIQLTINECQKYNIKKMLSISVDFETSIANINIAKKYPEIYCTVGIHPNSTLNTAEKELDKIESLINKTKKIIGIGETGLDYYREYNKENQCLFFTRQIELAIKYNMPIIVHTREAENDTYNILKKFSDKNLKIIIHCFSGSDKFALKCIEMGCYISFSGNITFKNADNLRKICKMIDLNKILIETDSPYLSPVPFRGKKNRPSNVRFVCEKIAQIKQIEFSEVSSITTKNFNQIFFNE